MINPKIPIQELVANMDQLATNLSLVLERIQQLQDAIVHQQRRIERLEKFHLEE